MLVYQGASRNTARSPFDIQDALLADRLRCHLTMHGENINIIAYEIEKMDSPSLPVSPSSPIPIMSYEHLVSSILLQKSLEAGGKPPRKGPTCRKPSNLSESYTIDWEPSAIHWLISSHNPCTQLYTFLHILSFLQHILTHLESCHETHDWCYSSTP